MRRVAVAEDVCDVLLPAGHPLALRSALVREDLVGERWICRPPGSVCHDWLHSTLRSAGREPDVACYVAEFQTRVALAAAGLGIVLLPRPGRGTLPRGRDGVVPRPLEPAPTRRLFAVWRQGASHRPAITAALRAVRALREASRPPMSEPAGSM